jgi:hypothetical protein
VSIWISEGSEILLPRTEFTLNWNSSNADSCSISGPSWNGSGTSGSQSFNKSRGTYDFSINCQNESGSASGNTGISIREVPSCQFTADPAGIVPPQISTLSWSCQYVSQGCKLDGDTVEPSGTKKVSPTQTTNYQLICSGLDGESHNTATVSIDFIPWFKEIIPIWR